MSGPLRVCVFGSSKDGNTPAYLEMSRELGRLLGEEGHICVNGAGNSGCMGALNDACLGAGGRVVGVIHKMWVVDRDELHKGLEEVVIVDGPNLSERKNKLMEGCDCLISLPGGVGTFDELFQAIAERQLGLATRPIVLMNVEGFYDGVWAMLAKMKETGLLYKSPGELVYLAANAADAVAFCRSNLGAATDPNPVAVPRTAALKPACPAADAAAAIATYEQGVRHGVVLGTVLLATLAYGRMWGPVGRFT